MLTIESLKTKYDKKNINFIEKDILDKNKKAVKNREEFIAGLFYLEATSRFRDNPKYKNSGFRSYISDLFQLSYSAYSKEKYAFLKFPKESKEHGPGLVNKVREKCGTLKIEKVFQEISKTPTMKKEQINKIIEENSKPKKIGGIPPSMTKKSLQNRVQYLEKENGQLRETVAEQLEQIKKMKVTISSLKKYKKVADSFAEIQKRQ